MVKTIYTPILRWRQAEIQALRDLNNKNNILPMMIFQYPTKILSSNDEKVFLQACGSMAETIPQEICSSWGDGREFFADFDVIEPQKNKEKFANDFIKNATKLNLMPIPVVDPYDSIDFIKQIIALSQKHLDGKICLRLRGKDLTNPAQVVKNFCSQYKIPELKLSIIADLLDDTSEKSYADTLQALMKIETITLYDNLIIAASAFPIDMSKITDEKNTIAREEWNNWQKYCSAEKFLRYPTFADYTIRHPIYNPSAEFHLPSATIKYTLSKEWLFLRGKKGKNEHYLSNASTFVKTPLFYGKDFSAGDEYIAKKGEFFETYRKNPTLKGTGNAREWIYAGINHHITVVADQLANLRDTTTSS